MKRFNVRVGLGMILWGLLSGSLLANPATAALVTFNFTGTVTQVGSNLGASPFGGSPILLSGSYTFNPATSNSSVIPSIGQYNNTISNLTFQLGTYGNIPGTITPNSILVANNFLGGDGYLLAAPFSGAAVNGRNPLAFEFDLTGNSSAFGSTALPTTPPSLSSFATKTFRVIFAGGVHSIVQGTLTSLTAVPLPATVILFGAGLVALAGLGAGSWRQRRNDLT